MRTRLRFERSYITRERVPACYSRTSVWVRGNVARGTGGSNDMAPLARAVPVDIPECDSEMKPPIQKLLGVTQRNETVTLLSSDKIPAAQIVIQSRSSVIQS